MEGNRLVAHLKKLKQNLAPMTWRQRFDHLWTYYKWILAVLVFVGFILQVLITSLTAASTDVLLSGMGINVPLTEAGVTCLTDDYFERLEGQRRQDVQFTEEIMDLDNEAMGLEMKYATAVKVSGLISTESLDYLILDTEALEYYSEGDLFIDLGQIFSEEDLSQMNIITVDGLPKLIDLTGTWFADTHIPDDGPYYLAFAYTTARIEQCRDFWQYLNHG